MQTFFFCRQAEKRGKIGRVFSIRQKKYRRTHKMLVKVFLRPIHLSIDLVFVVRLAKNSRKHNMIYSINIEETWQFIGDVKFRCSNRQLHSSDIDDVLPKPCVNLWNANNKLKRDQHTACITSEKNTHTHTASSWKHEYFLPHLILNMLDFFGVFAC